MSNVIELNDSNYLADNNFLDEFMNDFSVLCCQIKLPSFVEKQFKLLLESTTKILLSKNLIIELNGREFFFDHITLPSIKSIAYIFERLSDTNKFLLLWVIEISGPIFLSFFE